MCLQTVRQNLLLKIKLIWLKRKSNECHDVIGKVGNDGGYCKIEDRCRFIHKNDICKEGKCPEQKG